MSSDQAPKADTFLDFIRRLAEVSVLLGAGLFLIGWSYLYGYYRAFGLSADDLGLSVDNVLVHSIPVILGTAFRVSALVIVLLLLAASYFRLTARWLGHRAFVLLLIVVAGPAVSRYASSVGRDNARRDEYVSTSTLPYVTFEGAMDTLRVGCSLGETNYRLLLRSNGQVFVILPIDSAVSMNTANLRVCSFPESRIQAMRIQVGLRER